MRAVIDTNILIRALIKPDGTVGPVLRKLAAGAYTIIYSEPLLKELLAKLVLPRIRDKYHVDDEAVEVLLEVFALRGQLVLPDRTVRVCRDPNDDMLIEAALSGKASYVITGDQDLLVLKSFETVRFVTPHVFLQKL